MSSSRSFVVLCAAVLWIFTSQANGQNQYYLLQITPDDDGSEKVEEILATENEAVLLRLNAWVQDIDRICDLTEEQEQKLRVVVKGAAGKRNEARKKEVEEQVKRFTDRNQVVSFTIMSKSPRDVDNEKIWTSTLGKILDDEQEEKYNNWQQERKLFQKNALVSQFVAEIDQSLFLSTEQREKMTTVIAENFGNRLVSDANAGRLRVRRGQIRPIPEPKYLELVEDFLSETQLSEWKRSIEPILQRR